MAKYFYDYTKAMPQYMFIANTNYIKRIWSTSYSNTNGSKFSELSKYYTQTNRVEKFVLEYLNKIVSSQNDLIRKWINYWATQGIVRSVPNPNGEDMYQYYQIIAQLQGFTNNIKRGKGQKQDEYYEQVLKSIDEAQKFFDPYEYVRDAIFELMDSNSLFKPNTLDLDANAIQKVLTIVERRFTAAVIARATQNMPKYQQDLKFRNKADQIAKINYQHKIGSKIEKILQSVQGTTARRSTRQGHDVLTSIKGNSIRAAFKNSNLQGYLVSELISDISMAILGAKTKHTGTTRTRTAGSILIQQQNVGEKEKLRANKDDVVADITLADNTGIKIHISNKLYGRRGKLIKDGVNLAYDETTNNKVSDKYATRGLRNLQLEGSATLDYRMALLQNNFQGLKGRNYQKLIFGIVNLAKESYINAQNPGMKTFYENILAQMFSAFMFNASYEDMTNNLPEEGKPNNIYLFNVNGVYFTLAEIASKMIAQVKTLGNYSKKNPLVKVSITPSPAKVIANKKLGSMFINDKTKKMPPFEAQDWYSVRNKIITTTKISAVRIDAIKTLI